MARASWKLCSMSGLHTPSASPSMALSSLSPSSPSSGLPLALHSLDAMVAAPPGPDPEPQNQKGLWERPLGCRCPNQTDVVYSSKSILVCLSLSLSLIPEVNPLDSS